MRNEINLFKLFAASSPFLAWLGTGIWKSVQYAQSNSPVYPCSVCQSGSVFAPPPGGSIPIPENDPSLCSTFSSDALTWSCFSDAEGRNYVFAVPLDIFNSLLQETGRIKALLSNAINPAEAVQFLKEQCGFAINANCTDLQSLARSSHPIINEYMNVVPKTPETGAVFLGSLTNENDSVYKSFTSCMEGAVKALCQLDTPNAELESWRHSTLAYAISTIVLSLFFIGALYCYFSKNAAQNNDYPPARDPAANGYAPVSTEDPDAIRERSVVVRIGWTAPTLSNGSLPPARAVIQRTAAPATGDRLTDRKEGAPAPSENGAPKKDAPEVSVSVGEAPKTDAPPTLEQAERGALEIDAPYSYRR